MNITHKFFYWLLCCTLSINNAYSQCHIKNPLTTTQRTFEASRSTYVRPRGDWQCDIKVIQVNFHFVQKTNGTRNFRANDDGYGGNYTVYDYAHKIIESLNSDLLTNTKMHIPPANNTAVTDKKYKYVVRGVYFHQNDAAWTNVDPFITSLRNATSANHMEQIDIFITTTANANTVVTPKPGTGGYASSTSSTPGDKYTVCNEYTNYEYYIYNKYFNQWANPQNYFLTRNEIFEMVSNGQGLFNHELNHLLTLDHTVMYPWGSPCPTVKDNGAGSVDPSCDDFCWDTPNAWFMRDNLNAPRHPANVSGTPKTEWETWGSNNRMEYSGYNALTPNQLSRIHSALENINWLRGYLLCERVKTDIALCAFDPNITLFSGKKVTINKNCALSNQSIVNNKRYVKVVYNDNESTEIFNGFDVKDGGYFEVLSSCVCN